METPIWARDLPLMLGEVYTKMKAKLPEDPEERLIDIVEWLGRIPSRHPRRVHVSDVLTRQRILTLYEMNGVTRLRNAIERGHSLRMFLGERTASIRNRREEKKSQLTRNDLLFSDWGLLHFHLGADLANEGKRVMRTRRVLIAHLTQEDAYLLDAVPHGKGFHDTWGQKGYLETLLRNWPHVLEKYEMKGIAAPAKEDSISAEDYIKLRQGGVAALIDINGKVFMGPGLGITTDRSSTLAVQRADHIREELGAGEINFRNYHPQGDALLFVGQDASVGYFISEENKAVCVFPGRNRGGHVTEFFRRLLDETEILSNTPDGAIWIAPRPDFSAQKRPSIKSLS